MRRTLWKENAFRCMCTVRSIGHTTHSAVNCSEFIGWSDTENGISWSWDHLVRRVSTGTHPHNMTDEPLVQLFNILHLFVWSIFD